MENHRICLTRWVAEWTFPNFELSLCNHLKAHHFLYPKLFHSSLLVEYIHLHILFDESPPKMTSQEGSTAKSDDLNAEARITMPRLLRIPFRMARANAHLNGFLAAATPFPNVQPTAQPPVQPVERVRNAQKQQGTNLARLQQNASLGETNQRTFAECWIENRWNHLSLSSKTIQHPHTASITSIDLDKVEARFLLSCSLDASVAIFDIYLEEFTPVASINKAHENAVTCCEWYPPDTGMFCTASADNCVKVWDANTLEAAITWNLDSSVVDLAMSPLCVSNQLIATATNQPTLRLCDLRTASATHTLIGHSQSISCVAWSPINENMLASAGLDKEIRLWDIRKANSFLGRLDMRATEPTPLSQSRTDAIQAHDGAINGLCFTPQGHIVSTGTDEKVRVWDMSTNPFNTLINFGPHLHNRYGYMPLQLAHTPDGTFLFHPTDSGDILVYELWTGKLKKRLRGHLGRCNATVTANFAGNGWQTGRLFSCGADGELLYWTVPEDVAEAEDAWTDGSDDDAMLQDLLRPASRSPSPPRRQRRRRGD
jgi:DNA excision repair protein ERCC-8